MRYDEFINNILETRGRFACGDEYHERHHIIPRCIGGTNDEENLIDLFAKEHFEAHRLLALENPHIKGLTYAWWAMSVQTNKHTKERYHITAEEYEEVRVKYAEMLSKTMIGENNPNYGNHILRGRFVGEKHPCYGKRLSSDMLKKWRDVQIGKHNKEKNSMYGKCFSEEHKQKLSEAGKNRKHSEKSKEKMRNSSRNKAIRCLETDKTYKSITYAANETGISRPLISNVCNGKQDTAGGYHWEFINQNDAYRKPKMIHCIETKTVYSSASQAEKETGVSHTQILKVCKGEGYTAGGYHWEFVE